MTWNSRGPCGSWAPGSHRRPSDTTASKISHAKRGARQSPQPDDQALLPRQKPLPVRDRGPPAVPRRPDPSSWRGPQPQHWAEGLRPGWQEAPHQRACGLDRLQLARLLSSGGGWPAEPRPEPQGPARRGAPGRPRARDRPRAAGRGEKRRQEDLGRLRCRPLKSRRTAKGAEEAKGAGRVVGLPQLAPGHPEKSKGKRGPSRKTCSGGGGGGHRPDPEVRRDLDVGMLWAAAGGVVLLGDRDRDRDGGPGGRRISERTARPARPARLASAPKNDYLGQRPQGQAEDDVEPPWPVDGTWGSPASPPASPRPRGEGSRWKRELESVFRELFSTNMKLKRHLNQYLEAGPGPAACPVESEDWDLTGACGRLEEPRWEPRRERRPGDTLMELGPGPAAEEDARSVVSSANLKELLYKLKDRQYRRMVEPRPLAGEGPRASHAEVEGGLPWGGVRSRHEPPTPDPLLPQLSPPPPPARGSRARAATAWPRRSLEQRWRPQLVEVLEVPQLSWEALGLPLGERGEETETRVETGTPTRARPAHVAASPSPPLEEARGCQRSTTPPPAVSSEEEEEEEEEEDNEDSRHSQRIRDLEEQILEQSKSHKQFLEQARRRLLEFQSEC